MMKVAEKVNPLVMEQYGIRNTTGQFTWKSKNSDIQYPKKA
jgi:hypothetical protein